MASPSCETDELTFYHFNDVYHITHPQLLSRFAHVFRSPKTGPSLPDNEQSALTVFSGDAFSPSLESSVMKGEHMLPVLNHLLVDVACYGNHDFDFGEEVLTRLSDQCSFPWLLSNAIHADGRLLASAREYLVIPHRGYRIGFFGLAGTDWPSNCQHLPPDCDILDPILVARRLSRLLRSEHNADIVVAITHMRHEEDFRLADASDLGLDLILGGHDHDLAVRGTHITMVNDIFEGNIKVVKSGTDFKSYSKINLSVSRKDGKTEVHGVKVHQMRDLSLPKRLPEDAGMQAILSSIQSQIATAVDGPLVYTATPLEGRFNFLRTQETNLGNIVADAVRAYYDTDIAFMNAGSLRYIVPFDNAFVVKRLTGRIILEALENAVCDIIDGRFFHMSGLSISVGARQPVGSRVLNAHLVRGHTSAPAESHQLYTVTMVAFIAEGYDGYTLFKDTPTLVSEEGAMTDASLLMQIFRGNVHADKGQGVSGGDGQMREDETDMAVDRARAVVVVGKTEDGLPIVRAEVQGRIRVVL
ncbi:Metallo-dependent phosphatase [Leucogyrophana mollusca]|uniref:Metallo-dependent phosphatase n=1 Tax=Leucogyrophana mollusca TaxID=85980 RepID=A0ACB8BJN5_9AGAM|nr:Metallo-dependent phosphatase [Leucogyrophana mollusca]